MSEASPTAPYAAAAAALSHPASHDGAAHGLLSAFRTFCEGVARETAKPGGSPIGLAWAGLVQMPDKSVIRLSISVDEGRVA